MRGGTDEKYDWDFFALSGTGMTMPAEDFREEDFLCLFEAAETTKAEFKMKREESSNAKRKTVFFNIHHLHEQENHPSYMEIFYFQTAEEDI